jgi:hypothetical protein
MIEALIDGQAAPEALAALAHGRLQATPGGTGGGAAWPGDGPSPLYAAAASGPSRCSGCGHRPHR